MLQGLYKQMQDDAKKRGERYHRIHDVSELRRALKSARDGVPKARHKANSSNICHLLRKVLSKYNYESLLVYAPFGSEPNIVGVVRELLAVKKIYFPKVTTKNSMEAVRIHALDSDLVVGSFGIREPRSLEGAIGEDESIDVALVPGLGFNPSRFRLGHGHGYYDRFFSERHVSLKVGCFFESQFVGHWKEKPHDVPMDFVVTEDRIYG